MDSQSSFADSTPPPQLSDATTPSDAPHRARWRWVVATLLVGSFPLVAAYTSTLRADPDGAQRILPSSVAGLIFAGTLQFAFILLFIGLGWLFSRATKAELWLNWRNGIGPLWQGALYSIGLRVLAAMPLIGIGIWLATQGYTPKEITQWFEGNKPQTDGIVQSIQAGSTLYKATMLTFFSFVVAGLGEELWRVATMRGLLEILPRSLPYSVKCAVAVVVSAVVFGIGHWYQGLIGVGVTAFIGIALGTITLSHRSIWPAVIAHGLFDATSFLMAILEVDKIAQKMQEAQGFWWF